MEEWRAVVGYEGHYEVSDHGRVRSLARCEGYLKPDVTESGHFLVSFNKNGQRTRRYLHVVILEAFVGPSPAGMEGRHLNGDPSCNVLQNLHWATRRRNLQDRKWHKGVKGKRATKFRPNDVIAVREMLQKGVKKSAIAKLYNCHPMTVRAIEIRKTHCDVV